VVLRLKYFVSQAAEKNSSRMKILLVDDDVLLRKGLRELVLELGEEVSVLEAGTAREALALISEHTDVSLILLDLKLPDQDGLSVLTNLRKRYPRVPIVVLSGYYDDRYTMLKALENGALGFIPKSSGLSVTLAALRLVVSGGTYIPPQIFADDGNLEASTRLTAAQTATSSVDSGLTAQQLRVLALLMQGRSNKGIGKELRLAESTVKVHMSAILKALHAKNRTEAVIIANKMKLDLSQIM
jgi:DNA-binding NarL/FixJ family response regulator